MLKVVVSNQTNPYWNIAVENHLLSLPDSGDVVLYLWRNHRTIVIGQNQNPFSECDVKQLLDDGGFFVRRTTGGGAVYHDDGNLNFSFVAPYGLYDQQRQFSVIRQALLAYGLQTELSGRNDLLCQGRKFSGNAFSRGRHQRLHHGTLLIQGNTEDMSRYLSVRQSKLQKHGVASVRSRVVNLSELADVTSANIVPHLIDAFQQVYGSKAATLHFDSLLSLPQVEELYRYYSSPQWLFARWSDFTAQRSAQFPWGHVELSVLVDQARSIILDVTISTDALDVQLPARVRSLLVGSSTKQPPRYDEHAPDAFMLSDILSIVYS